MKDVLGKTKIKNPIVTEIAPFENWWDAETYHQQYLVNNPGKESLSGQENQTPIFHIIAEPGVQVQRMCSHLLITLDPFIFQCRGVLQSW